MNNLKQNYALFSFGLISLLGIIGSFLLIAQNTSTPDLGLFIFSILILATHLFILSFTLKDIKINLIGLSLILAYIFLAFGYVINTKSHSTNFFVQWIFLTAITINLTIPNLTSDFFSKYPVIIFQHYLPLKFDGLRPFNKDLNASIGSSKDLNLKSFMSMELLKGIMTTLLIFALLGIPLILIILGLLVSSSDTFSKWMEDLINPFDISISFGVQILRLIFVVIIVLYMISEFMFARLFQKNDKSVDDIEVKLDNQFALSTGLAIQMILAILNLFYIVFIIAQLKYDFGDLKKYVVENNIDSFSNLAVSRFWELIVVIVINGFLIYIGRKYFRQITEKYKITKIFIYSNVIFLVLNTLFLIISVHQRLYFYIENYGLTYRRFIAYGFLPILIITIFLLGISLLTKKPNWAYSISVSLVVIYFSLIVSLPTSYIVNKFNFEQGISGNIKVVDPTYTVRNQNYYYTENSDYDYYIQPNEVADDDGLLVSIDYLNSGDLSKDERELLENKIEQFISNNENQNWREFNIMKYLIKENYKP